ncbi:MAG: hypothetical protein AAFX79_09305 [Planctomycetota bacterium]
MWPTVIGVLCCVFGGLALLGNLCGLIAMPIASQMPGMPPQGGIAWWLQMVAAVAKIPVSILHLAAGVQLLSRKPSGVRLAVIFAWYAIAMNIIGAAVQVLSTQAALQQQGQQVPLGFNAGFMVAGTAIACIWPAFLLFWLRRERIRIDVLAWRGEHACRACGYALQDLVPGVCPECGLPFDFRGAERHAMP